jgi:hypothetical protein
MADEQQSPDEEKGGATELVTDAKKEGEEDVSGHVVMNTPRDEGPSLHPQTQTAAKEDGEDDVEGHAQID